MLQFIKRMVGSGAEYAWGESTIITRDPQPVLGLSYGLARIAFGARAVQRVIEAPDFWAAYPELAAAFANAVPERYKLLLPAPVVRAIALRPEVLVDFWHSSDGEVVYGLPRNEIPTTLTHPQGLTKMANLDALEAFGAFALYCATDSGHGFRCQHNPQHPAAELNSATVEPHNQTPVVRQLLAVLQPINAWIGANIEQWAAQPYQHKGTNNWTFVRSAGGWGVRIGSELIFNHGHSLNLTVTCMKTQAPGGAWQVTALLSEKQVGPLGHTSTPHWELTGAFEDFRQIDPAHIIAVLEHVRRHPASRPALNGSVAALDADYATFEVTMFLKTFLANGWTLQEHFNTLGADLVHGNLNARTTRVTTGAADGVRLQQELRLSRVTLVLDLWFGWRETWVASGQIAAYDPHTQACVYTWDHEHTCNSVSGLPRLFELLINAMGAQSAAIVTSGIPHEKSLEVRS